MVATTMDPWQIYLGVGVLLSALEMFSGVFLFLPVGLAFMIAGLTALWVPDAATQLTTLGVASVVLFGAFQVWALRLRRRQRQSGGYRSAVDAMVGDEATVIAWDTAQRAGYVKRFGDEWKARALDSGDFEVGEKVTIVKVDGNSVSIRKKSQTT